MLLKKRSPNIADASFAVAFNSASTALQAAYFAAGLSPTDRVITTPNSYVASCAAPFQKKANVIFLDIDLKTGNIDLESGGIQLNLPHSRGRTFLFRSFCRHGLRHGELRSPVSKTPMLSSSKMPRTPLAPYYPDGETKVGSCQWSQMTVFSFHPAKTITTGEGGMVTTNDPELYEKLDYFETMESSV